MDFLSSRGWTQSVLCLFNSEVSAEARAATDAEAPIDIDETDQIGMDAEKVDEAEVQDTL